MQTGSGEKLLVAQIGFLRMLSTIFISLPVTMFIVTVIYNNIKIINNVERLQDPILLLRMPMGMQKNFSKNYQ
jgi:hypothetical protein